MKKLIFKPGKSQDIKVIDKEEEHFCDFCGEQATVYESTNAERNTERMNVETKNVRVVVDPKCTSVVKRPELKPVYKGFFSGREWKYVGDELEVIWMTRQSQDVKYVEIVVDRHPITSDTLHIDICANCAKQIAEHAKKGE